MKKASVFPFNKESIEYYSGVFEKVKNKEIQLYIGIKYTNKWL